jgi:hypothetical protein
MILKGEQKRASFSGGFPSIQQLKDWDFQNLDIPFLNGVLE